MKQEKALSTHYLSTDYTNSLGILSTVEVKLSVNYLQSSYSIEPKQTGSSFLFMNSRSPHKWAAISDCIKQAALLAEKLLEGDDVKTEIKTAVQHSQLDTPNSKINICTSSNHLSS